MYEPYPVPELARDHKNVRYSSLWTFAKQDLRLLIFFSNCRFYWSRDRTVLDLYFYWLSGVFRHPNALLYLVNDWIANRPYDVPPICMAFGGFII